MYALTSIVVHLRENSLTTLITEMRNHNRDVVGHVVRHYQSGCAARNVHLCLGDSVTAPELVEHHIIIEWSYY